MNPHRALGALAIVQLLLAVLAWWPRESGNTPHALIDLARSTITAIEISRQPIGEATVDGVRLAHTDDGWIVQSSAGYPAKQASVDALLDRLLGLKVGRPIATQLASHNALKVGDTDYGRRVKLDVGSETLEYVLGAATSRAVNVRRSDERDVYVARGASEWSFSDADSSYYDANYVHAEVEELSAVSIENEQGELRFERAGDHWTVVGLAEGRAADSDAIASFLQIVTRVAMSEPVGREASPEYGLDDGLRIDWTLKANDQSAFGGYRVGSEEGAHVYVKASDHLFTVKAAKSAFARLREAALAEFVTAPSCRSRPRPGPPASPSTSCGGWSSLPSTPRSPSRPSPFGSSAFSAW